MSRDPYRGGRDDFGYGGRGVGSGGNRWDSDRFAAERRGGSSRFDSDREIYEERDSRVISRGGGFGRPRERSVDEIYERRGPRFEDDRYERRHYHEDDSPRFERDRPFARAETTNITIEKERYSPSPPRRASRPTFLRRQSSLDTFDRKPLTRFVEREEYGPPARYRQQPEFRPPPFTPIPLPKTRQLGPPPRRYPDRDYEDIRVAEPDYYGDEEYRGYPERVREREIIRRRRRSRSRESRSYRGGSVRSDSISSASSSDRETTRNEFPKRGKTRMPARLVSKQAIIDLGYPFEEEGDTIIIMKALGRENIDEVIKLSEDYKGDKISGGRSDAGATVIEERKTEQVFTVPPPPPPGWNQAPPPPPGWMPGPPPPPPVPVQAVVTDTKITETHNHGGHAAPVIIDAGRPHHHHDHSFTEVKETQVVESSAPVTVGPLALALPSRPKDERSIRAEIRALELEKEALRAEKRSHRRRASRHGGRVSESEMVLYDHERNEDVTIIRKERVEEPEGGVRIEKDRKGRMAISVPKYVR